MQFRTRLKPCSSLIDMTPLVDVVFLLLIFFFVTSDILPLKSLHIEHPEIARNAPTLTTHLVVVMDKEHVIYVGARKDIVDLEQLKEHLKDEIATIKARAPWCQPSIVLSVDRNVDYGAFLRLFATVQECSPRVRLTFSPTPNSFGEESACSA